MTGHTNCKTTLVLPTRFVNPRRVLEEVAALYGERPEIITGRSRTPAASSIRCLAAYALREVTPMSFEAIGALLGGRDHSTAMHAVRRCRSEADRNPEWRAVVDRTVQKLRDIAEEEANHG